MFKFKIKYLKNKIIIHPGKNLFVLAVMRDEFRTQPRSQEVGTGDTAILECRPPKGQPEPRVR